MAEPITLDYRGRRDHAVLDEVRDLLLAKREGVALVRVLVDTEKFAEKIALFAAVTGLGGSIENRGGYWAVILSPPSCGAAGKQPA